MSKFYDSKCAELAAHFLLDVPQSTSTDKTNLIRAIQDVCEDFCREIEGRALEPIARVKCKPSGVRE